MLTGRAVSLEYLSNTIIGVENRFYMQIATYWPRHEDDGFGGWSYGSAIQYYVRWEEWVEERFDSGGDKFLSRSIIWLPAVVAAGGYLYLGQSAASDPTLLDEAFVIREVVDTPALRGNTREVRAYL